MLLALALLASARALAGEGAAAPLRLIVEPDRILLWQQGRASLSLRSDVPIEWVRFSTNVGQVGEVRRTGESSFAATWFAPEEAFPQIAVLSASARVASGWIDTWAALPLWGLGNAEVRAAPNAEIGVGIGDRRYGPVRTNARGVALVPVEVAPGDTTAFHGDMPIPLKVPSPLRIHLSTSADAVPAGREVLVPVRAQVVAPDGAPVASPQVAFDPAIGAIEEVRATGPGELAALWRIPATSIGKARLRARPQEPGAKGTSLELRVVRATPDRIELTADAKEIVAGRTLIVLTARAVDADDRYVPVPLAFASNLCDPRTTEKKEGWTALCAIPTHFGGVRSLEVNAHTTTVERVISAELEVPLRAAEPARILVEPSAPLVRADGNSSVAVRVRVEDRFGNAVEGATPELIRAPQAGALGPFAANGSGQFVADYRVRRLRADGLEVIRVRSGPAEAQSELTVRGYVPWLSVAPAVWFVSNLRDVNAPRLSVEAEAAMPLFADEVLFAAELGGFAAPFSGVAGADIRVEGETSFATALGSVSYRRRLGWGNVFLGGSGGAARLWHRIAVDGQPDVVESGWAPAFAVGGGAELTKWLGGPRILLRFLWVGDPALESVGGPLRSVNVGLGYRFELL